MKEANHKEVRDTLLYAIDAADQWGPGPPGITPIGQPGHSNGEKREYAYFQVKDDSGHVYSIQVFEANQKGE